MTARLHQALVDGRSFSQALRDFPRIFPTLYVNMVGAGEASGALPDILSRVVEHLMQAKNLRDRVQQALIYPAFLAIAGAALITIFITFMVPQLTQFHVANRRRAAAADAHSARRRIISSPATGGSSILIVVGAVIGFRAFVRSEEGRLTWDRFRLLFRVTDEFAATNTTRSFRARSAR